MPHALARTGSHDDFWRKERLDGHRAKTLPGYTDDCVEEIISRRTARTEILSGPRPLLLVGYVQSLDLRKRTCKLRSLEKSYPMRYREVLPEATFAARRMKLLAPLLDRGLMIEPLPKAQALVAALLQAWRPTACYTLAGRLD